MSKKVTTKKSINSKTNNNEEVFKNLFSNNNNNKKSEPIKTNILNTKTSKSTKKSIINNNEKDDDLIKLISEDDLFSKEKNKDKKSSKKNLKASNKKSKETKPNNDNDDSGLIKLPLSGKRFVITGLIEGIKRYELEDYIKFLGGTTTSAVSGKTDYLIYGEILENGFSYQTGNKYKTAIAKNIKTFSVSELNDFLGSVLNIKNYDIFDIDFKTGKLKNDLNNNSNNASENNSIKSNISINSLYMSNNLATNNSVLNKINNNLLWTEKYKPSKIKHIIGNKGAILNITQWLRDWEDVVIHNNKKPTKFKAPGLMDNVNASGCLISGPPGIGKTTFARVLASELGYTVMELNASDQRNKDSVNNSVGFLKDNATITFKGFDKTKESQPNINKKTLIIMDEIDGLSGNQDRGGLTALITIIKETKVPIICICNDKNSQKFRSLRFYVYEVNFNRPSKSEIAKYLLSICSKEGIKAEYNALETLAEYSSNDIRQCINYLDFFSRKTIKSSKNEIIKPSFTYSHFMGNSSSSSTKSFKDESLLLNNYEATRKLLNPYEMKNLSIYDKLNLYFIDFDFIPLLIFENYLGGFKMSKIPNLIDYSKKNISVKNNTDQNPNTITNIDVLSNMSETSECISYSDIIDKRIREDGLWRLLPEKGLFGAVLISSFAKTGTGIIDSAKFFGRLMTEKKNYRILKELSPCFPQSSRSEINLFKLPILLSYITNGLKKKGKDCLEELTEIIANLQFDNLLYKENFLEFMKEGLEQNLYNKFSSLSPGLKSSLTKSVNDRLGRKTKLVGKTARNKLLESKKSLRSSTSNKNLDISIGSSNNDSKDSIKDIKKDNKNKIKKTKKSASLVKKNNNNTTKNNKKATKKSVNKNSDNNLSLIDDESCESDITSEIVNKISNKNKNNKKGSKNKDKSKNKNNTKKTKLKKMKSSSESEFVLSSDNNEVLTTKNAKLKINNYNNNNKNEPNINKRSLRSRANNKKILEVEYDSEY